MRRHRVIVGLYRRRRFEVDFYVWPKTTAGIVIATHSLPGTMELRPILQLQIRLGDGGRAGGRTDGTLTRVKLLLKFVEFQSEELENLRISIIHTRALAASQVFVDASETPGRRRRQIG